MNDNERPDIPARRNLNFFQTLKAVAWAFFGVRKEKHYKEELAGLNPVHIIVAGLLAALVFVIGLILAARWFVAHLT